MNYELPLETMELLERGLPKDCPLNVKFEVSPVALLSLNEFSERSGLPSLSDGDSFYRIGTDDGSQLCLQKGSGCVWAIDPLGEIPKRFASSTLALFIKLLNKYAEYAKAVRGVNDSEAEEIALQFVESMQSFDERAFNDPDDWWPSVCQQMEFGML